MAEWLCSGLQSRVRRFDSDSSLHLPIARWSPLAARFGSVINSNPLNSCHTNFVNVKATVTTDMFKIRCTLHRLVELCVVAMCFVGCGEDTDDTLAAFREQANSALASGNWPEASLYLKNVLQLEPEDSDARFALGLSYYRLSNFPAARKEFETARQQGAAGVKETFYLLQTLEQLGDAIHADVLITQVPEDVFHDPWIVLMRARIRMLTNDIETTKSLLAKIKTETETTLMAWISFTSAEIARIERQYERALQLLAEIPDDTEVSLPARRTAGEIYLRLRNYEQAEREFNLASELLSGDLPTLVGLIQSQIQLKKFPDAEQNFAILSKRFPDVLETHYLSGLMKIFRGEQAKTAVSDFRKVLAIEPDHVQTLKLMTELLIADGHAEQAIATVKHLLLLTPEDEELKNRLEQLNTLQRNNVATGGLQLTERLIDLELQQLQGLNQIYASAKRNADQGFYGDAYSELNELSESDKASRATLDAILLKSEVGTAAIDEIMAAVDVSIVSPANEVVLALRQATADYDEGELDRADEAYANIDHPARLAAQALIGRAMVAARRGEISAAMKYLNAALKTYPAISNFHVRTAAFGLSAKDSPDDVARMLRNAIENNVVQSGRRLSFATRLSQVGRVTEALKELRDISPQTEAEVLQVGLLRGLLLLRMGKVQESVREHERLNRRFPTNVEVTRGIFNAHLAAKMFTAAQDDVNKLSRLEVPADELKRFEIRYLMAKGETAEAKALIRDALRDGVDSAEYLFLIGNIEFEQKNYHAAKVAYETALAERPSAPVMRQLAATERALGNLQAAIELLREWLLKHDGDLVTRSLLAVAYREHGQHTLAVSEFEILFARGRQDYFVIINLAELLAATDEERAQIYIDKAVALNANHVRTNALVSSMNAR